MPQDLWDRAQALMAALRIGDVSPLVSSQFRRYLLSGFVKCGVCDGNYAISTAFSYRCGTHRNRGPVACSNHLAISRRRLEQTVIAVLRDRLYAEENLSAVVDQVRDALSRCTDAP